MISSLPRRSFRPHRNDLEDNFHRPMPLSCAVSAFSPNWRIWSLESIERSSLDNKNTIYDAAGDQSARRRSSRRSMKTSKFTPAFTLSPFSMKTGTALLCANNFSTKKCLSVRWKELRLHQAKAICKLGANTSDWHIGDWGIHIPKGVYLTLYCWYGILTYVDCGFRFFLCVGRRWRISPRKPVLSSRKQ